MEQNSKGVREKFVQVLAKAATNKEFLEKLKADPEKTLEDEGVVEGGFFIPVSNKTVLDGILRIYNEMGGVICKKR